MSTVVVEREVEEFTETTHQLFIGGSGSTPRQGRRSIPQIRPPGKSLLPWLRVARRTSTGLYWPPELRSRTVRGVG